MGITIHFNGKIEDLSQIDPLVEELMDISKSMEWEWKLLDHKFSITPESRPSQNNHKTDNDSSFRLKGIVINLHPDCESFCIFFDEKGNLTTPFLMELVNEGRIRKEHASVFVKTQFAPPDVHINIINLLKYIKKRYIPGLNVSDEGEYWESEDKENLIKKITFLNKKMDQVEGILSSFDRDIINCSSPEQLAQILAKKIRDRLK